LNETGVRASHAMFLEAFVGWVNFRWKNVLASVVVQTQDNF
jgi:hypothetical protein